VALSSSLHDLDAAYLDAAYLDAAYLDAAYLDPGRALRRW
jgi:hypothetical protein